MELDKKQLGNRLKSLRYYHGALSIEDSARSLGISPSKLQQAEQGRAHLRVEEVVTITNFYKVSLEELLFGDIIRHNQ